MFRLPHNFVETMLPRIGKRREKRGDIGAAIKHVAFELAVEPEALKVC